MHIHQTKDKTYLLRQSLRDGNTVKKLTLCNLSRWPADKIEQLADALEAKRRGDLQAPARIINLLAEQGVFDEKVLRRGKDKEKWIHLPAEPSLYWQTMTTLQRAPRLPRQRRKPAYGEKARPIWERWTYDEDQDADIPLYLLRKLMGHAV